MKGSDKSFECLCWLQRVLVGVDGESQFSLGHVQLTWK